MSSFFGISDYVMEDYEMEDYEMEDYVMEDYVLNGRLCDGRFDLNGANELFLWDLSGEKKPDIILATLGHAPI